MTILYSVLHLLVDGVCAMAMFGNFLSGEDGYFYILVYNFCAFALQMPFGALLDIMDASCPVRVSPSALFAAAGVFLAVAGAFTHPAVLGIGNALFHVGGGVGCIREDHARNWRGRGLGVFVAPGALGLYLGTLIAKGGPWKAWVWGTGVLMLLLCLGALYCQRRRTGAEAVCGEERHPAGAALLCLAVVILRSYIGMSVSFPWKTGIAAGILAVLALAGGKAAGGFAGARFGFRKTAAASLLPAALFYFLSSSMPMSMGMPMGLAALFFFNMTMPITLYWMVCIFPKKPGFAFGFLTFALFLGFLPGYFGLQLVWDGGITGGAGSLVSLALLWGALHLAARPEKGGNSEGLSG